ncbi:MAG: PHB depolymerase family esterase [Acidimicrobiales bacterium]
MTAATMAMVLLCSACSSSGTASPTTTAAASTTAAKAAAGPPVPSSGCAKPQTGPVTNQRLNIEVDGASRWYLLNTPSPATPSPTGLRRSSTAAAIPRPLVIDFHGLSEGAVIHSTTTMFGQLGQKDGFVAVFPEGTGSPVQWNTSATAHPNADLEFVTAMLNQLEAELCIDTSRVYASGLSDGSFMVSLVACTMANRFAAVAAVSGLQLPKPCRPTRRVPVIAFNGTADPILFFNGGVGTATLNRLLGRGGTAPSSPTTTAPVHVNLDGPGFPATVKAWALKDGCNPHATDARTSSQIILRTYRCPAGTGVQFYIIIGGGHAWPGSRFSQEISSLTGFTTFQINATDVIWAFFQRFRL